MLIAADRAVENCRRAVIALPCPFGLSIDVRFIRRVDRHVRQRHGKGVFLAVETDFFILRVPDCDAGEVLTVELVYGNGHLLPCPCAHGSRYGAGRDAVRDADLIRAAAEHRVDRHIVSGHGKAESIIHADDLGLLAAVGRRAEIDQVIAEILVGIDLDCFSLVGFRLRIDITADHVGHRDRMTRLFPPFREEGKVAVDSRVEIKRHV